MYDSVTRFQELDNLVQSVEEKKDSGFKSRWLELLPHTWLHQFSNIEQAETSTITLKQSSLPIFNEQMANTAIYHTSPFLTSYSLKPLPPLLPFISDAHLLLVLPIIAYWAYGLLFHYIDKYDYLPQYRLHTPAELLKRNHVSVSEVVTYVLKYQALTTAIGIMLTGEPDLYGLEEYQVANWASRVNRFRKRAPVAALAVLGVSKSTLLCKRACYPPKAHSIRLPD